MVCVMYIRRLDPAITFCIEVEIVSMQPTKESRFRVKITAGSEKRKTEIVKINRVGDMPKWTQRLTL